MSKFNNLSRNIFVALLLGAFVGVFIPQAAPWVNWMGLSFKLSLKMIVMPIVLSSILCGLESIGDIRKLKGLGKRALLYYSGTTIAAIITGLVLVCVIQPGVRSPRKEILEAINSVEAANAPEMLQKLSGIPSSNNFLKLDDFQQEQFVGVLKNIAGQEGSRQDLQQGAIKYYGALELRSRLKSDAHIEIAEKPSFGVFIESQIENALKNPFEALAKQQVLAVIVFTMLFGGAMTTIGPLGKKFFAVNRAVNLATIKVIELIMGFAPFGVFGLLAPIVAKTGPEVFQELSLYALCVVLGLLFHLLVFLPVLNYLFTKQGPISYLGKIRSALLVAFSTSSSNATLPVTMRTVEEELKVDKAVSRFVLPLGATVNMDGTALYEAVAAVFIAQLYGVSLGVTSHIIIAVTAAFAAVGTAGIPAAGTVTMALILSALGLPMEGVGLLLALDRPLDMCRTVVNIAGDITGCNILNKYYLGLPNSNAQKA